MMVSVEVSAAEVLTGIVEIKGTLAYLDDAIEFAYKTTNMARRVSEAKSIRVPLENLQELEYKSSIVSSKIILYPKHLDIMEEMPGVHSDKMIFQIKQADKKEADVFVSFIKNRLYELGETGMESIAFQLADTNLGMTQHSGLLYLDEEFLVFEIQSGLSGLKKSESQIIKIEPGALEAVRLDRGRLKDALTIKPKTEALLSAMPGEYKTEVKLKIAKRDRRAAERLVSRLRQRLQGSNSLCGPKERPPSAY